VVRPPIPEPTTIASQESSKESCLYGVNLICDPFGRPGSNVALVNIAARFQNRFAAPGRFCG
jgi:hypothetical protein